MMFCNKVRLILSVLFSYMPMDCFAREKLPSWNALDSFQGLLTKQEFENSLKTIYCPRVPWHEHWLKFNRKEVLIRKQNGKDDWYILSFRDGNLSSSILRERKTDEQNNSLKGLRIALDPGHIGGDFSEMEGRHFSIRGGKPIKEGDLALSVAQVLSKKLIKRGVQVHFLRKQNKPVTKLRPQDFERESEDWVNQKEVLLKRKYSTNERQELLSKRKEVLFYRVSEIHARAALINDVIRPDLVICLHLNAAPWPNPDKFELVERNDFHVLVNGCYMGGELSDDHQRFEMLYRLLNGWHKKEQLIAENISNAFSRITELPAFNYKGPNALKIGKVPGVWARNLLANRIYRCPVVFLEPYVANSKDAFDRIILGNYKGRRKVNGELKKSLIEEYAESVFRGIQNSYPTKDK